MDLTDEISLPLAPLDDPNKAFILKQCGLFLSIELDAKTSQWPIPSNKVHHHRRVFADVTECHFINRLLAEHMLGITQQVTNMLPVLKPLTFLLLEAMQRTYQGKLTPVTPLLLSTIHK